MLPRVWLMQPIPVLLPGKSCGQRSLVGYSPWGHKDSDITKPLNNIKLWSLHWEWTSVQSPNRLSLTFTEVYFYRGLSFHCCLCPDYITKNTWKKYCEQGILYTQVNILLIELLWRYFTLSLLMFSAQNPMGKIFVENRFCILPTAREQRTYDKGFWGMLNKLVFLKLYNSSSVFCLQVYMNVWGPSLAQAGS